MANCGNVIDIIYNTSTLVLIIVLLGKVLGKIIDYILNMYQQHKTAAKKTTYCKIKLC